MFIRIPYRIKQYVSSESQKLSISVHGVIFQDMLIFKSTTLVIIEEYRNLCP